MMKITSDVRTTSHPAYRGFTLFSDGIRGLGVVQQFYIKDFKYTYWGPLDSNLLIFIFHSPNFEDWWNTEAKTPEFGEYPIFEARKVMWALGMKPLKKELWETKFY